MLFPVEILISFEGSEYKVILDEQYLEYISVFTYS
jgi:hypothetical protein